MKRLRRGLNPLNPLSQIALMHISETGISKRLKNVIFRQVIKMYRGLRN